MAEKTLYTAIGRFERRTNGCGRSFPVVVLGGREYMVDLQEMVLWSLLNWRIARKEEIGEQYQNTCHGAECTVSRSWEACVDRLLIRGLLISGSGETEYDALYDLLSSLYIIPVDSTFPMRIVSFLHLTLFRQAPFTAARRLFQKDHRNERETEIMCLAKQAFLSTAEIIRCIDKGVSRIRSEQALLEQLYDDEETTSDNIASMTKCVPSSRNVIVAVANLYLRQQIMFERI